MKLFKFYVNLKKANNMQLYISNWLWCVLLLSSVFYVAGQDCGPPSTGRIEIAEGSSYNLTCQMCAETFPNQNSSNMGYIGLKEPIQIVNETTIMYELKNAKPGEHVFTCVCGGTGIKETVVAVGTAPKPVRNFNCQSEDFEYMVCSFERPHNYVIVTYKLTFHKGQPYYKFPTDCQSPNATHVVCNITKGYTATVNEYNFTLELSNSLGQYMQTFQIKNSNVMKPGKPQNFHLEKLTDKHIKFSWSMSKLKLYNNLNKDNKVEFEVVLTGYNGVQQELLMTNKTSAAFDLTYAYYNYTLQITTKMIASNLWSDHFEYKFRTLARRPARPPNTTPGSFFIDPSETKVRIFWEELQFKEYSGYDFKYIITSSINGKFVDLNPVENTSTSADYVWHKEYTYDFQIRSQNNMGESEEFSLIHIPKLQNQQKVDMHKPQAVTNLFNDDNLTFTISWLPPLAGNNQLIGYTVYWCQPNTPINDRCSDTMRFKNVSAITLKYTRPFQNLIFAVSANYENFNTGMHWTTCTSNLDKELIKMKPDATAESSTVISLNWGTGHICSSILRGFNLMYCEVQRPSNANIYVYSTGTVIETKEPIECLHKNNITVLNISDNNAKNYSIEHLKPFTFYRIEMKMYSKKKEGKFSDPIYIQTKEAAPTAPLDLRVSNVTNTSAILSWQPPATANGIIRSYELILNGKTQETLPTHLYNDSGRINYKLENLKSNSSFQVAVRAFTVNYSEPSKEQNFSTLIGNPKMPENGDKKENTDGTTVFSWEPPKEANGGLEFYEVVVAELRNDIVFRQRISLVNGTSCQLRIPACEAHEHRTKIDVRAVNVADLTAKAYSEQFPQTTFSNVNFDKDLYTENEDLHCESSNKQAEAELRKKYDKSSQYRLLRSDLYLLRLFDCGTTPPNRYSIIALSVVISGVGAMIGIYVARNVYKRMADITLIFPPGLEYYLCKNSYAAGDVDTRQTIEQLATQNIGVKCFVQLPQEGLTYHNERHHLLSTKSNDLSFLEDVTNEKSLSDYEKSTPIPEDYKRSVSQSSSDSNAGSSASTVVAESPPNSTNYIKSSDLEQHELNNCTSSNNYISVDKLPATGYINPAQLQQTHVPMSMVVGYTTAEQLAKMNMKSEDEEKTRISGYVTPGDLNVFSRQQNRQVFDENRC